MRKTYMSLAVSRAWGVEHPVGDPFGGPAYGERNMPVVAIGAAVWGGMALAAGGLTVLGTIAAIGAVTAGVGLVTGNEKLQKIGGIMGLIGGVGALASGAGLMSEAADIAMAGGETGAAAAADVAAGATQAGSVAADAMTGVVPDVSAVSVGGGVTPVVESAGAAANAGGGLLNSAAPTTDAFVGGASGGNVASVAGGAAPVASQGGIMDTLSGYIKPFSEFAKDNPMAAYGIMNTAGNLIGGAFDPLKPAQVEALDANTDLARQRAENIAAPLPGVTSTAPGGVRPNVYDVPVPKPYNQVPINTGLINNGAVTGPGRV